jgi:predicted DNA-binding transcriptional regulator YafY
MDKLEESIKIFCMPVDTRFAQETRLKYLDSLLFWEGRANRIDLIEKFQISPAQAALDLRKYLESADARSVTYDTRAKRYEATHQFRPVFGLPSPEDWLRENRMDANQIDVVPTLGRHTDVQMLAQIYRAIRDKQALQIGYQSMTDADPKVRWIAPHALASDGLRWHARSYCFLHEDYRDFVLTRMAVVESGKTLTKRDAGELPPDKEWSSVVELDLVPAATLGATQAAAIRREYGFKRNALTVRVRQALLFYAIRRWGLDRADSRLTISEQRVIQTGRHK